MSPAIRFSIWPRPTDSYADTLAVVKNADETGWHGLWFADHYMADTPDGAPSDGPMFEAWTVLPALAASTKNLRLGTLVSPTTFHHPSLLANRAASLDLISNGRFVLGLGAGWQVNEHKAYGIDLRTPKDRVDRFAEAIAAVRSLLDKERTTIEGAHFHIADAPCNPKPVQRPLPILVGTGGPRMLRLTARHAQEWNTWGAPATVAAKSKQLDEACEKVGRDPSTIHRTAQPMLFFVDDEAKAEAMRAKTPADRAIVGNSAYITDQVGAYIEAGLDELIIPDFTFGPNLASRLENFDRFRTEVASHFAGSGATK